MAGASNVKSDDNIIENLFTWHEKMSDNKGKTDRGDSEHTDEFANFLKKLKFDKTAAAIQDVISDGHYTEEDSAQVENTFIKERKELADPDTNFVWLGGKTLHISPDQSSESIIADFRTFDDLTTPGEQLSYEAANYGSELASKLVTKANSYPKGSKEREKLLEAADKLREMVKSRVGGDLSEIRSDLEDAGFIYRTKEEQYRIISHGE